jgi:predicted AlkP superfamily phosphohydrolase/phosphomutase
VSRVRGGLLAAALLATCALSCSGPPPKRSGRVFLIGLDGATWTVIDPLLAQGRLPNLAALIREGTRAPLESMIPTKSPALWTTVATGKGFDGHGINDFTETIGGDGTKNERVMHMTSNMRTTKALWNIVGDRGESCAFVGWWVTWPAEPVRGTMVTSHVPLEQTGGVASPTKGTIVASDSTGQTWPPELFAKIAPMIRTPESVTWDEARRFMDIRADEMDKDLVLGFRWAYAADETYRAVIRKLLEEEPDRDLWGLYFNGIDVVCHRYWKYREPERYRAFPPEEIPRFREVIERYYEYTDQLLGEILAHRRPGDSFLVLSDHGFHANGHKDGPPGILIAAGENFAKGARLKSARLVDIAPTVLALLGLPQAGDMDGRVLDALLTSRWRKAYPRDTVPTYDTAEWLASRQRTPVSSGVDAALMERLRGLGYIQ